MWENDHLSGIADIAKALAHEDRLRLMEILLQKSVTVEELSRHSGLTVAGTSHHLQILKARGLVASAREGKFVRYRPAGPEVVRALMGLREMWDASVRKSGQIAAQLGLDRTVIGKAELLKHAGQADLLIVDLRPEDEFKAGHIRGAINIPLEDLENRLARLPSSARIVVYCRGPYCVFSDRAVAILSKAGFQAQRLEEGFPEWWATGGPVQLD